MKFGEYKLRWDGNGPDVQVRFVNKDKDVVATVSAKLVQSESKKGEDSFTI